MIQKEIPNNGNTKNIEEITENAKIEFPVTFDLKAVISTTTSDKENMINLSLVLDKLKVKNSFISKKRSSKGTYISYGYKVTLLNKTQLENLYSDLKSVPGLKLAL